MAVVHIGIAVTYDATHVAVANHVDLTLYGYVANFGVAACVRDNSTNVAIGRININVLKHKVLYNRARAVSAAADLCKEACAALSLFKGNVKVGDGVTVAVEVTVEGAVILGGASDRGPLNTCKVDVSRQLDELALILRRAVLRAGVYVVAEPAKIIVVVDKVGISLGSRTRKTGNGSYYVIGEGKGAEGIGFKGKNARGFIVGELIGIERKTVMHYAQHTLARSDVHLYVVYGRAVGSNLYTVTCKLKIHRNRGCVGSAIGCNVLVVHCKGIVTCGNTCRKNDLYAVTRIDLGGLGRILTNLLRAGCGIRSIRGDLTCKHLDIECNGLTHKLVGCILIHMYGECEVVLLGGIESYVNCLGIVVAGIYVNSVVRPSDRITNFCIACDLIGHFLNQGGIGSLGYLKDHSVLEGKITCVLNGKIYYVSIAGLPKNICREHGCLILGNFNTTRFGVLIKLYVKGTGYDLVVCTDSRVGKPCVGGSKKHGTTNEKCQYAAEQRSLGGFCLFHD